MKSCKMSGSNVELRQYLDQFYPMTDAEYKLFSSFFFLKHVNAKQALVQLGEVEENIYYVVKGIFKKYFTANGQQHITGFYQEKDICLSVVSYFTGMPAALVIEALEPSVCLGIRRRDLEYLFTEIPGLEKIFRGVLSTFYVKKDIDQMNYLRFSKKERFLQFCDAQPELLRRVPQKQLASYLQITPETFCRMKRLRYEMARQARLKNREDQ